MLTRKFGLIAALTLTLLVPTFDSPAQTSGGKILFMENIEATVNDEVILGGEVDDKLQGIFNLSTAKPEEVEKARRKVREKMIEDILIYQAGVDEELSLDPVELERRVEEELQSLRKVYDQRGGFDEAMKKAGRSVERTKEVLRTNIQREHVISQALLRHVNSKVEVSQADVAKFKEEHPDEFMKNQMVRISQIILSLPQDATPEAEAFVKSKADDVLLRIKAGASFTDMMDKHSEHETKLKVKDTMDFYRGELLPEFDRAFNMQTGEVSDVFRTPMGFHIIRVESKQSIEDYLTYVKRKQLQDEWVASLREKAQIVIKQPMD